MIYEVEFTHGEQNTFVSGHETFAPRTQVIIQNEKGKTYGRVMKQLPQDKNVDTFGEIVRAATEADEELIYTTDQLSQQACTKIRKLLQIVGLT